MPSAQRKPPRPSPSRPNVLARYITTTWPGEERETQAFELPPEYDAAFVRGLAAAAWTDGWKFVAVDELGSFLMCRSREDAARLAVDSGSPVLEPGNIITLVEYVRRWMEGKELA